MNNVLCFFLFVFLLLSSCKHSNERYYVGVIGHAAAGLDVDRVPYPGNTQESIDYARSIGVKHIEIDIQLSADKHWVLFHNDVMDFHTTHDGCINQYNSNYLKTISYHGYSKVKIQLLNEINVLGFETVYLDVRHYLPCENFTHIDTAYLYAGIDVFVAANPDVKVSIITNKPSLLPFYHTKGLDVWFEAQTVHQALLINALYPYTNFVFRNRHISAEQVAELRNIGKSLIIYDVKSYEGNIDAMRKNPNFVMTDAIASALILSRTP
jgi:glycerophosphoryl diester phosphodiesterase